MKGFRAGTLIDTENSHARLVQCLADLACNIARLGARIPATKRRKKLIVDRVIDRTGKRELLIHAVRPFICTVVKL